MSKKIRVLFFDVDKDPVVREMGTTLEDWYAAVGSPVQFVPYMGLDLICNEHGKFNGQKPNRALWDGRDIVFGPFFFARHDDEGEVASVTDEDVALLTKEFARR